MFNDKYVHVFDVWALNIDVLNSNKTSSIYGVDFCLVGLFYFVTFSSSCNEITQFECDDEITIQDVCQMTLDYKIN